jgi:hypothetical protein
MIIQHTTPADISRATNSIAQSLVAFQSLSELDGQAGPARGFAMPDGLPVLG